jgi:hypothetical protein
MNLGRGRSSIPVVHVSTGCVGGVFLLHHLQQVHSSREEAV